jgi:NAD(P)-dependent dehydrogenase (short-subunit alcohol dehydrogenase family)
MPMKVIVTGSSFGIGKALAERLVENGCDVCGLSRSQPGVPAPRSGPGTYRALACDVAKWVEVERAVATIADDWGHADALVTCAGTQGELGRALLADPVRWSETVRVNLDGTYHAVRAAYPLLRKTDRRAKIVCFSGGGATKARAQFSAYSAAKTAVVRLVETIAEEEKSSNLDINALAPGAINTRMTEEILALGPAVVGQEEYDGALKQSKGGGGSLSTALDAVEWLLSAASDGISGRLLSAPWDRWLTLGQHVQALQRGDVYTLRRILPEERGLTW